MQNNSARRIIMRGIGTRNMTATYIDGTPTQNNSSRRIILRRIILHVELFCVELEPET